MIIANMRSVYRAKKVRKKTSHLGTGSAGSDALSPQNRLTGFGKFACGEFVEINTARQTTRRQRYGVISRAHLTGNPPRRFAARHIEHLQRRALTPRSTTKITLI
jgi:hypothetical protein